MQKWTPHTPLPRVKALLVDGKVRATLSALVGAAEMGFDFADMLSLVSSLAPSHFHKSMTTHADHRVWQDVYRIGTRGREVYLKLTVIDDVLIVSFKEA